VYEKERRQTATFLIFLSKERLSWTLFLQKVVIFVHNANCMGEKWGKVL